MDNSEFKHAAMLKWRCLLIITNYLFVFLFVPFVSAAYDANDNSDEPDSVFYYLDKAEDAEYEDDQETQELYLNKAISLAKKIKDDEGLILAYIDKSNFLIETGDVQPGLDLLLSTLEDAQRINYSEGIEIILSNLGLNYLVIGMYPQAISYINQAMIIQEKQNDSFGLSGSINNLAIAYENIEEYDQAEQLYGRLHELAIAENDTSLMILYHINMIDMLVEREEYERAEMYLDTALDLNRDQQSDDLIYIYILKAILAETLEQEEQAHLYNQKAYSLSNEYGDAYEQAMVRYMKAEFNFEILNYDRTRSLAQEALEITINREFNSLTFGLYELLSQVDSIQGNFSQALENYKNFIHFRDIVYSEDNAREMTRQTMQSEFDKREALTSEQLKRRQLQRNISIFGFGIVLCFAVVFWRQRNRIGIEKDRSEHLLLNILPFETAQELKQKGYADAQVISDVTVLFTDFKGFTQMSESMPPDKLVAAIHECFSAFDRIMEKYGVEKIKTIGDAYMAAGGLPTLNSTHPQDVVHAALDIQEYMKNHIMDKKAADLPFFEIRIGVHTGPVVAGIVGIKKFQYDIWGDTVNTASRMESSGEVGRVNVSETTKSLVENDFSCEYRGQVEAKGKGKIAMYFVSRK